MTLKDTTQAEVDMTRPQPCMQGAGNTVSWLAKLEEEMWEVKEEWLLFTKLSNDVREKLAEEITDIITVCTSWLQALGYDEKARGEIQRKVNEKNKERGYW